MDSITQEQAHWLVNEFAPLRGRTLMKEVLSAYLEAERILRGREKHLHIGCKCELPWLKEETERLYSNWYKEYVKQLETN